MALNKSPHVHDFKLIIRRLKADNMEYTGKPGEYAIILTACSCGAKKGVDMGPTPEMAKLYKRMIDAQKSKVTTVG